MSDDELAALKKLGQDLRYWKKFAFPGFAAGVLNLDTAVQSLSTPDPFVYARKDYASRWLICKVGSQFKALFHTAGVWHDSSDLDTGNYVPEGEIPPTQIAEGRIQRMASNRCQIDYTIDTRYDKSLFGHQANLEALATKEKEFNQSHKPRRSWQKGDKFHNAFTFSAQVFVRPYGYDVNKLNKPPYSLHPWVRDVVQPKTGQPEYYANPHRPELWDCTTGTMVRIDKADPPFMQKGDIVWMSFYVEFIIGQNTWSTQLTPKHIIRVGVMPAILLAPAENSNAPVEQEPDYSIQEGATFVMNVDFPMYDEVVGDSNTVSSTTVVDPGTQDQLGIDVRVKGESDQNGSQDTASPVAVTPSYIAKEGAEGDSGTSAHKADSRYDSKAKLTRHDADVASDGSLTPPPATPEATTPARWSPSPVSKKPETGGSGENKIIRGNKRGHGDAVDGEVAQPAKKGRQATTRRGRNA